MPLAFPSVSHGQIAFGFFNIESDMLLLEQLFFFADRFCAAVLALAREPSEGRQEGRIEGWRIAELAAVGNLHGAIAGVDRSGFIGATYERFPFPARPEAFKQSPDGARSQAVIAEMIAPFGRPETIRLSWDRHAETLGMAEYRFDLPQFAALVGYVEQGGYPRYALEKRPSYVRLMTRELARLGSPLLPAHLRSA